VVVHWWVVGGGWCGKRERVSPTGALASMVGGGGGCGAVEGRGGGGNVNMSELELRGSG